MKELLCDPRVDVNAVTPVSAFQFDDPFTFIHECVISEYLCDIVGGQVCPGLGCIAWKGRYSTLVNG